jgi:hypothetical protein
MTTASVLVNPGFSTRVALGKAPEPPVPTREIRPGVDIPEGVAKQEFDRERNLFGDRGERGEQGERGESASQERREPIDDERGSRDVD